MFFCWFKSDQMTWSQILSAVTLLVGLCWTCVTCMYLGHVWSCCLNVKRCQESRKNSEERWSTQCQVAPHRYTSQGRNQRWKETCPKGQSGREIPLLRIVGMNFMEKIQTRRTKTHKAQSSEKLCCLDWVKLWNFRSRKSRQHWTAHSTAWNIGI